MAIPLQLTIFDPFDNWFLLMVSSSLITLFHILSYLVMLRAPLRYFISMPCVLLFVLFVSTQHCLIYNHIGSSKYFSFHRNEFRRALYNFDVFSNMVAISAMTLVLVTLIIKFLAANDLLHIFKPGFQFPLIFCEHH